MQLSWTACNGAVAYNIYRGLTPGGEGTSPYATVNHATSFTDAGVTGGQGYYYSITAVNFSGESTPSAEVAAAVFSVEIGLPSASQATGNPITYAITYVNPFFAGSTLSAGNVTLNETGTANGTLAISGTGATRTVTISNIMGDGSLGISITSGTASDTLGNLALAAGPSATFTVYQAQWNSSTDGSWSTNGNWIDTVSGATIAAPGLRGVAGDTVLFASATGSTISLDGASPSVAAITFDNSNISYTVSQGTGGGVLHLANGGSSASITVSSGSHTISAPLALDSDIDRVSGRRQPIDHFRRDQRRRASR